MNEKNENIKAGVFFRTFYALLDHLYGSKSTEDISTKHSIDKFLIKTINEKVPTRHVKDRLPRIIKENDTIYSIHKNRYYARFKFINIKHGNNDLKLSSQWYEEDKNIFISQNDIDTKNAISGVANLLEFLGKDLGRINKIINNYDNSLMLSESEVDNFFKILNSNPINESLSDNNSPPQNTTNENNDNSTHLKQSPTGYQNYLTRVSRTLMKIFENPNISNQIFHINGKWGEGKSHFTKQLTSIISRISENNYKTKTTYFDCWEFSNEKLPMQKLVKKIISNENSTSIFSTELEFFLTWILLIMKLKCFNIKTSIYKVFTLTLATAIITLYYINLDKEFEYLKTFYSIFIGSALGSAFFTFIAYIFSMYTDFSTKESKLQSEKDIFNELISQKDKMYHLIVIENLDRCSYDFSFQFLNDLMSTINNEEKNSHYINKVQIFINCDYAYLSSMLKSKNLGPTFLQKTFTGTINIPTLNTKENLIKAEEIIRNVFSCNKKDSLKSDTTPSERNLSQQSENIFKPSEDIFKPSEDIFKPSEDIFKLSEDRFIYLLDHLEKLLAPHQDPPVKNLKHLSLILQNKRLLERSAITTLFNLSMTFSFENTEEKLDFKIIDSILLSSIAAYTMPDLVDICDKHENCRDIETLLLGNELASDTTSKNSEESTSFNTLKNEDNKNESIDSSIEIRALQKKIDYEIYRSLLIAFQEEVDPSTLLKHWNNRKYLILNQYPDY